ncbi:MAG: hypothetical protein M1817_002996 [Caeruleum heppii]|nr:MAG: hypothetical protein M1817_002996 [Caeruleum heppii]
MSSSTSETKLFILPCPSSPAARILTLPHPRTEAPTRYYHCPSRGIYEFTQIAAPKKTPRSWLLVPKKDDGVRRGDERDGEKIHTETGKEDDSISKGHVTSNADLFIATPIDPLFLVLPLLSPAPSTNSKNVSKPLFHPLSHYFDILLPSSPHSTTLLSTPSTLTLLESRLTAICDTVEAGDESMYRLNEEKLIDVLVQKARGMVKKGLPASLEERFVKRELDVPMIGVKREDSLVSAAEEGLDGEEKKDEGQVPSLPADESMASTTTDSAADTFTSVTPSLSTSSSNATSISTSGSFTSLPTPPSPPSTASPDIIQLLCLRTALRYMLQTYVPDHLSSTLSTTLFTSSTEPTSPSTPDFAPLNTHLAHLASLRATAIASLSSLNNNYKRVHPEDEGGETRAQKKKRLEEEERKKKANQSRGVRDLKKVDVSGMKRLEGFFGKKAKVKA